VIRAARGPAARAAGARDGVGGRGGQDQGRHSCHDHRQPGGGGEARARGCQGPRPPDTHHLQVSRRRGHRWGSVSAIPHSDPPLPCSSSRFGSSYVLLSGWVAAGAGSGGPGLLVGRLMLDP
jgi:hypothetical protein